MEISCSLKCYALANQSSLVCLDLLSYYIFKLFLYTMDFVASYGQVERKLPLTQLYCNYFSF